MQLPNIFHFTDKPGWNGIRAQKVWRFVASRPPASHRPLGAYFTDIEPTETNVKFLHKRIRVPRAKQEYVFSFAGIEGLSQLNNGRGRDKHVFYSAMDYEVVEHRQRYEGITKAISGQFS